MPTATPEQEAWTQGYDACRQHVGKQRLPEVLEAVDLLVRADAIPRRSAATLTQQITNIFSDLGFPFAGDRITEQRWPDRYRVDTSPSGDRKYVVDVRTHQCVIATQGVDNSDTAHAIANLLNASRMETPVYSRPTDPRCDACRVPEHDVCPLVPGCPCCADSSRKEG